MKSLLKSIFERGFVTGHGFKPANLYVDVTGCGYRLFRKRHPLVSSPVPAQGYNEDDAVVSTPAGIR